MTRGTILFHACGPGTYQKTPDTNPQRADASCLREHGAVVYVSESRCAWPGIHDGAPGAVVFWNSLSSRVATVLNLWVINNIQ